MPREKKTKRPVSRPGGIPETSVSLNTLKADPRNPRRMHEDAAAGLAVSLETFGALDIVFNEQTGELVSGHQRIDQLRLAGGGITTGATNSVSMAGCAASDHPMRNHTRPGEVVYEPFSGSGSQIVSAEQLGRRCFAMEIEPRYVDVAVARWEKFTGKKAVRSDG